MSRHLGPCRGCGVAMLWAETLDGKRQPFNREPDPEGNRVLLGRGPDRPPLAVPASAIVIDRPADEEEARERVDELGVLYMPHHATCPKRKEFKGPRSEA